MFIRIFRNVHLDMQELELNPCLCVILLVACFGGVFGEISSLERRHQKLFPSNLSRSVSLALRDGLDQRFVVQASITSMTTGLAEGL